MRASTEKSMVFNGLNRDLVGVHEEVGHMVIGNKGADLYS